MGPPDRVAHRAVIEGVDADATVDDRDEVGVGEGVHATLQQYVKPSQDAVAKLMADTDPDRRRR